MPENAEFPERVKIIGAAAPANYTGAAFAGRYVSMKNYQRITIVIHTGAWAAGTAAVTLSEALNVAGGTPVALNMDWMYTGTVASGALTRTAVVADTFNLAVADSLYVIDVDASELNIGGGYDCISVLIAQPGANNDFYNVDYFLHDARYAEATPPSAIVN